MSWCHPPFLTHSFSAHANPCFPTQQPAHPQSSPTPLTHHRSGVVLRVDSPGGDALASDLMWREIRKLADKKPVVACMGDVAASGGYYMSMAAQVCAWMVGCV